MCHIYIRCHDLPQCTGVSYHRDITLIRSLKNVQISSRAFVSVTMEKSKSLLRFVGRRSSLVPSIVSRLPRSGTPAQLQCSRSGAGEPGNEATSRTWTRLVGQDKQVRVKLQMISLAGQTLWPARLADDRVVLFLLGTAVRGAVTTTTSLLARQTHFRK